MKKVDKKVGDMQRHTKRLNMIKESISRPAQPAPRHHPTHAPKHHAAHAAPKHAAHVTPQPHAEPVTHFAISKPAADELRTIVESMVVSGKAVKPERETAHEKPAASETVITTTLIDNVKVELILRKTPVQ